MATDAKYGKIEIPGKPDDMPVFIILGSDASACAAIQEYGYIARDHGATDEFRLAVQKRVDEFEEWQNANPDSVKVPD